MTISPEEFEQSINPQLQEPAMDDMFLESITVPAVRGEKSSRMYAGQAAMLKGSSDNAELLEIDAMQPDTKVVREEAVQNFYNQKQQELAAWLEGSLQQNPQGVQDALVTASEIQDQIIGNQTSPVGAERAYVEAASPNGVREQQQEMSFIMAAMNDINDMVDNQGWIDTAQDFAGMLVPFGYAMDASDIDKEISEKPELSEIAGANLDEIIMNLHTLPEERKKAIFPALKDAVIEATKTSFLGIESEGNMLKARDLLLSIIDPEGAAEVAFDVGVDAAIGAADIVPINAVSKLAKLSKLERVNASQVLKGAVNKLKADTTAAKVAAKSGDMESAAIHTVNAMTDDAVAESMNTTRVSAAMDATPIQMSEWFQEVLDDDLLPSAVAQKLNEAKGKAQGFARSMTTESDFMQIGALTSSERQKVIADFTDQFMSGAKEDYLTEGVQLGNLKITSQDKKGFTYDYTISKVGQPTELGTGKVKFSINDVTGNFSATVQDPIAQQASNIVSPATFSKTGKTGDFNAEVKRSIQSSDIAAAIDKKAADMLQWAAEPIGGAFQGKARQRVEDILLAGDEFINESTQVVGRTFTPTELAAGIETAKGTVRLTSPKEVEAYYRMRMFADSAWQTENQVLRRELELGGFKEVKMFAGVNPDPNLPYRTRMKSVSVGKPLESSASARASLQGKENYGIWDDKSGEIVSWTDEYIDDVYESGDQIVRLRKDWNTKGTGELDGSGEVVEYVRVKANRINDLPEQVLHYKPGYVPKDNVAQFAVKQNMPIIKRGVAGQTRTQAMRLFNSKADAERFVNEQIANYAQKHDVSIEDASRVFSIANYDDLTAAERLEDAVGAHGGLYHGERSKDEILFGLSGQQVERVAPFEAFKRQVGHLGTFVARNEVRVGAEKRWLNTVRKEFPEIRLEGFDGTKVPTNLPRGRALETLRRQIKEWNGIPTRDENMLQAAIQNTHDWMLNGVRKVPFGLRNKESIDSLLWLKNANPITAIKGAVMHSFLGMMSPIQIFTQASAMTVALSRRPGLAGKSLNQAIGFHMLDNVRNDTALSKLYSLLPKDIYGADLKEAHDAWRRTGLYESVFNNTDTAYIATNGVGFDMNTMANKASNVSLLFYRGGELANRRVSFLAEFNNWKLNNPGKAVDDDAIEQILIETNKNMLELNAANRAWWQGGYGTGAQRQVAGMATQFMQVIAKTLEAGLKGTDRGGFTRAEKARIFFGQAALFGAAGVPMASVVAPAFVDWLGADLGDEATVSMINQGFVGVITQQMFEMDSQVSNRFALGGAVTDLFKDVLTSEDPLFLKAMGAGGGLLGRVHDAMGEAYVALGMADRASFKDLTTEQIGLALAAFSRVPSTGRNLWKAHLMHNQNLILDRRGRPIVSKDFDLQTEIGQLMGFQPSAEARTRVLQWSNRETEELIDELVSVRVNLMHRAVYQAKLDGEKVAHLADAMQILDETMPEYVKMQVRQKVIDRVFGDNAQTLEERELAKFINRTAADKITEDALIDAKGFGGKDVPIYRPFKEILNDPQEKR